MNIFLYIYSHDQRDTSTFCSFRYNNSILFTRAGSAVDLWCNTDVLIGGIKIKSSMVKLIKKNKRNLHDSLYTFQCTETSFRTTDCQGLIENIKSNASQACLNGRIKWILIYSWHSRWYDIGSLLTSVCLILIFVGWQLKLYEEWKVVRWDVRVWASYDLVGLEPFLIHGSEDTERIQLTSIEYVVNDILELIAASRLKTIVIVHSICSAVGFNWTILACLSGLEWNQMYRKVYFTSVELGKRTKF